MQGSSFRDRERKKYHVVGGSYARAAMEDRMPGRPAKAPVRRSRRVKTPPSPGIPCRVKNAKGQYYSLMDVAGQALYLFVNNIHPEGHTFPSHHKASRVVWCTIERMKQEGQVWEEKEFTIENVR